jgi:hypothetical protein
MEPGGIVDRRPHERCKRYYDQESAELIHGDILKEGSETRKQDKLSSISSIVTHSPGNLDWTVRRGKGMEGFKATVGNASIRSSTETAETFGVDCMVDLFYASQSKLE